MTGAPKRKRIKVGVYIPNNPSEHVEALTSFAHGVVRSGHDAVQRKLDGSFEISDDAASVFGIRKERVPVSYPRGAVIKAAQKAQKPIVILETGYVHRDRYFAAGWNGLNGRAAFRNEDSPPDRWEKLDVELKPWRATGDYILVCGQVPWDASVQHHHHANWCRSVVAEIGKLTQRPIRFRPHPKVIDQVNYSIIAAVESRRPLEEDLADAWACVTFNSNSAVIAAIAGVPVFAFDKGSMALSIAGSDLSMIEEPSMPDRTQWARDLAYTQWTTEELAAGDAWKHLTRGLV